ncbi:MAG: ABC transporter permease [Verrucomicrobiales bacterium]|nr:ABC transporter permease [Verrucomicrobiales bacterium]
MAEPALQRAGRPPRTPAGRAWRRFRRNRPASLGAVALVILVALVALLPWLPLPEPDAMTELQFAAPRAGHWFGTDLLGRDLLARVLHGTRVSLLVGCVGAAVSLVIGVCWGLIAGYAGGRLDNLMMRVVDVLYALPSIIFVIVLMTALNGLLARWQNAGMDGDLAGTLQLTGMFAGLGAVSWLTMARIVRGQVLSLRRRPFVEASRVLGAGHAHVIFRHILPNVLGVVLVYLALTVPSVVLYESFLSYLGLGIQPPQASLGSLIAEGASQINPIRVYWWLLVFPAGTLVTTLLCLNFVADGLRDALDPKEA